MVKEFRYEQHPQEVTSFNGPAVFLAGPTVRGNQQHLQPSWRFEAIEEFNRQGFDGAVIIPEFVSKTESDKAKPWIPEWEYNGLKRADAILFWIPRTRELIGLTTNWELGYWMGKAPERVVYGRPDDAFRIDYLDIMWKSTFNDSIFRTPKIQNTLQGTVESSIEMANEFRPLR